MIKYQRGIGGLVPHARGGLVVGGRSVAHKPFVDDPIQWDTHVLVDRDETQQRLGFNDMTTDSMGRIYVGSVSVVAIDVDLDTPSFSPGRLYVIGIDGTVTEVADDIGLSV